MASSCTARNLRASLQLCRATHNLLQSLSLPERCRPTPLYLTPAVCTAAILTPPPLCQLPLTLPRLPLPTSPVTPLAEETAPNWFLFLALLTLSLPLPHLLPLHQLRGLQWRVAPMPAMTRELVELLIWTLMSVSISSP